MIWLAHYIHIFRVFFHFQTLLPQIAETHPAGISSNQGIHYIQEYISNQFRQYDHGTKKNLKIYGQEEPPAYPLENITAEMYIYYSLADASADYRDVERLPPYLSNLKYMFLVEDPTWDHIDFLFALKVKSTVNDKVVQFCKEYEEALEAGK